MEENKNTINFKFKHNVNLVIFVTCFILPIVINFCHFAIQVKEWIIWKDMLTTWWLCDKRINEGMPIPKQKELAWDLRIIWSVEFMCGKKITLPCTVHLYQCFIIGGYTYWIYFQVWNVLLCYAGITASGYMYCARVGGGCVQGRGSAHGFTWVWVSDDGNCV